MSRLNRFTPAKGPRYPLNKRLDGPQSRSGRSGEEKNPFRLAWIVFLSPKQIEKNNYCVFHVMVQLYLGRERLKYFSSGEDTTAFYQPQQEALWSIRNFYKEIL